MNLLARFFRLAEISTADNASLPSVVAWASQITSDSFDISGARFLAATAPGTPRESSYRTEGEAKKNLLMYSKS